jgi:hypothetical protein
MPIESPNLSTGAEPEVLFSQAPDGSGRLLADLPQEELHRWAEEFGLDTTRYPQRTELAAALEERRRLIASMDREAMLDVITWGRRSVGPDAAREQIAREIAAIQLMNFKGLSQRGLLVLCRMRGVKASELDDARILVHRLKKQEGFFEKFSRKKRAFLGKLVSDLVGENQAPAPTHPDFPTEPSIRRDIEESGLLGGITSRIKKTADQYLNQKLDEIESRIDRKLDEIDHRLSEWRDKEIANRIKILKITLWASVIVGIVSLIYAWIKVYLLS